MCLFHWEFLRSNWIDFFLRYWNLLCACLSFNTRSCWCTILSWWWVFRWLNYSGLWIIKRVVCNFLFDNDLLHLCIIFVNLFDELKLQLICEYLLRFLHEGLFGWVCITLCSWLFSSQLTLIKVIASIHLSTFLVFLTLFTWVVNYFLYFNCRTRGF